MSEKKLLFVFNPKSGMGLIKNNLLDIVDVMVKAGYVYENLMINLKPSNVKLRDRVIRIVCDIKNISADEAEKLLEENEFSIPKAVESFKNI